jgi:probable HAF family extracellular repeat protein
MTDLGTLGGLNSAGTNPNGAGQLTVIAETAKPDPEGEDFCGWGTHQTCLAAIWADGKLTALPTLGGNNAAGVVINERGQTVGASETTTRDSACAAPQVFRFLPAIWDTHTARVQALPLPAGDTVGVAIGINDRGDAVGTTGTCDNTIVSAVGLLFGPRAVLWRKNGAATDLGQGVAASINNRGEVTGGSPISEHEVHGFLWTSEFGMVDLGTVGNDTSSFPTMINNSGQITGGSCDAEMNCRAFLWDPSSTTMVDLNELIAEGSGLHLIFASWINEAGDVVGQAVDTKTGDLHAFLATPIRGGSTADVTSTPDAAPLSFTAREALRQRSSAGARSHRRLR